MSISHFTPQLLRKTRGMLPILMLATSSLVLQAHPSAEVNFTGTPFTAISEGNQPLTIALDSAGNVYTINQVNESQLFFVEKYTLQANGTFTAKTLATGGSSNVFSFLAVDANGNVYFTDTTDNAIKKLTYSSGNYTASTLPISISHPTGIAIDTSGNIYVGSTSTGAVYKETLSGNSYTQSTVASGLFGSAEAAGIAVDANGKVYIAQPSDSQFLIETPILNSYSSTTQSVSSASPYGIKVDAAGDVFVADTSGNGVIEEVYSAGIYAGHPVLSGFTKPTDIALDGSGNLYIVDKGAKKVIEDQLADVPFGTRPILTSGTSSDTLTLNFWIGAGTTIGSVNILTRGASGKDFKDAGSSTCVASAYDSDTLCTVNVNFTPLYPGLRRGAVVIKNGSGAPLATALIYGTGTGPMTAFSPSNITSSNSGLSASAGISVDSAGNMYVASGSKVNKISGLTKTSIGNSDFGTATGTAVDGAGNVYIVTGPTGGNIYEVTPSGSETTFATGLPANSIAVDGAGNLYVVTTSGSGAVKKISPTGQTKTILSGGFEDPVGIAVDAAGNIFVSDETAGAIYKVTPGGTKTTFKSGLSEPAQIAVDAADNIYVSEAGTSSIYEYSATGIATNLKGSVTDIYGAAVDDAGNVYYSATNSGYVNKLPRASTPTLAYLTTTEGVQASQSPKTITVENVGNAHFTVSKVAFASGFPQYSSHATDCRNNTIVNPGNQCTLTVEFDPFREYAGSPSYNWTGTASVTTNTLNVPGTKQSVSLTGTMTYPTAATPVISPAGGVYNSAQTVTMTCSTPGAWIFYTTNNSQPTDSLAKYTGAITVSKTTKIIANCEKTGYISSANATQTYTIN